MMLFAKDFPNMAAKRYEENDSFFVKMFTEQEMMVKSLILLVQFYMLV